MPSDTSVSVVIPAYKQAEFLPVAVQSVLDQVPHQTRVQVVVVDDGSPDDTAAAVAPFGGQIDFIRQSNSGVAAARNTGLAHATGEWVVFLDADDFLLPNMIATHLAALGSDAIDVSCSGWQATDAGGNKMFDLPPPNLTPDPFHALLPDNLCPPLCYMFRRTLIDRIGGFDPDRLKSGHEDWDLLLRVAAAGARFKSIPAPLAAYRFHSASASSRYMSMYDSAIAVITKTQHAHTRCPDCGPRFELAYQRRQREYAKAFVKPALTTNPFSTAGRNHWRHFLSRSAAKPSLAFAVAARLFWGVGKRFGFRRDSK